MGKNQGCGSQVKEKEGSAPVFPCAASHAPSVRYTLTHIHTRTHTCILARTLHTYIHAYLHAYTQAHMHTCTCNVHARTHICTNTHTHAYSYTQATHKEHSFQGPHPTCSCKPCFLLQSLVFVFCLLLPVTLREDLLGGTGKRRMRQSLLHQQGLLLHVLRGKGPQGRS